MKIKQFLARISIGRGRDYLRSWFLLVMIVFTVILITISSIREIDALSQDFRKEQYTQSDQLDSSKEIKLVDVKNLNLITHISAENPDVIEGYSVEGTYVFWSAGGNLEFPFQERLELHIFACGEDDDCGWEIDSYDIDKNQFVLIGFECLVNQSCNANEENFDDPNFDENGELSEKGKSLVDVFLNDDLYPPCTYDAFLEGNVTESCWLKANWTAPGNVVVNENVTLTILGGIRHYIDFTRRNLTIKPSGKVIVKPGGKIYGANNIWAVDDTEKIRPTDYGANTQIDHKNNPLSDSPFNKVWQNGQVHIFGGRNEVVAFQLIVEAIGAPTTIQALDLPKLCHSTGFCIENSGDPNDYYDFRGKHIDILSAHYIPIPKIEEYEKITPNPDKYYSETDKLPEIMVPISGISGKGGLPLVVPSNTNQALWFDIYIPKDAPPGNYSGNISIKTDGNDQTIPVNLEVFNFQLPDQTHLKHYFRVNPEIIKKRLGIESGNFTPAVTKEITKYFQTAYRHRVLLAHTASITDMNRFYLGFYNGDYYTSTSANKYYGPGEGIGHNFYPVGLNDLCKNEKCLEKKGDKEGDESGFAPPTREQWEKASYEWIKWFEDNDLTDVFFARYMQDEPHSPTKDRNWAYGQLEKYASWIPTTPGEGRILKTMCVVPLDIEGDDKDDDKLDKIAKKSCDVFFVNKSHYKVDLVKEYEDDGKVVGIYNGGNPYYGAGIIAMHTAAVDARVIPWVMEKNDIEYYFMWAVVAGYNNTDCKFFENNCSKGTSMYPSYDSEYDGSEPDMYGPLVSVRLKYWRRGAQDFEYFWLAKQKGLEDQVKSIILKVVPKAFDERPGTDDNSENPWPKRGYQFEERRRRLAELLEDSSSVNLP